MILLLSWPTAFYLTLLFLPLQYFRLRRNGYQVLKRQQCLNLNVTFYFHIVYVVGRVSAVGMATRYGLDSPGIESR
jgi:hypothetical protein